MAKMLEVALWPRFLGCFFPAALARLWREGEREREREGERGEVGREGGRRGRGREEGRGGGGGIPQPTQIPKRIHTQGPDCVIYKQLSVLLDY